MNLVRTKHKNDKVNVKCYSDLTSHLALKIINWPKLQLTNFMAKLTILSKNEKRQYALEFLAIKSKNV